MEAFIALKTAMATIPILALPDFTIETDASTIAIGVVLSQAHHLIAFYNERLGPQLQSASTYAREKYVFIAAIHKWRQYLLGGPNWLSLSVHGTFPTTGGFFMTFAKPLPQTLRPNKYYKGSTISTKTNQVILSEMAYTYIKEDFLFLQQLISAYASRENSIPRSKEDILAMPRH
uniref:Reverse transcriptase/retrotransposon-derived protein RNase H-like domain-containing protein n=1 Tax=Nelumbo nucifera TaxID=4432 RepID=A0A822XQP8_NELNU|nr:TPA_asm: hypothetical protein HUJ06_025397 [Nelumbo nucifera]